MAQWHLRSDRAPTGKKLKRIRKKRRLDKGSEFLETRVAPRKAKIRRCRGGNQRLKLLATEEVNLANPKTGKVIKTKVLSVAENPANPHFVRRNVLTKGAVVKTEAGLARITSRPHHHGLLNAVLLEEKK